MVYEQLQVNLNRKTNRYGAIHAPLQFISTATCMLDPTIVGAGARIPYKRRIDDVDWLVYMLQIRVNKA